MTTHSTLAPMSPAAAARIAQESTGCSDTTRELIRQLLARDAVGRAKYGTTLDRTDLSCCGGNDETPKSHCMDCSRYPGQLAQQPAAVDEAMVERAFDAWCDVAEVDEWRVRNAPEALRAALTAALAQPGGSDNDH